MPLPTKKAAHENPPRRYKLLQGVHSGPDLTQDPVVHKDPTTGVETPRWPSKTYVAGDVFESFTDLLKLGEDKFQLVGEDRRAHERFKEDPHPMKPHEEPPTPPAVTGTPRNVNAEKESEHNVGAATQTQATAQPAQEAASHPAQHPTPAPVKHDHRGRKL